MLSSRSNCRWWCLRLFGFFAGALVSSSAQELPKLATGDAKLDQAFAIALSDTGGNIHPYQAGQLESISPALMAGAGYNTPWTRDTAINVWNGVGLLWPDVARNTLLSMLERKNGKLLITGQYWDSIILATGAWQYYLYTGDRSLLAEAFEATTNTLASREAEEFDKTLGLFRGPAVYGDGVSAYPDRYAGPKASSGIMEWPGQHPNLKANPGYGLPMCTLSVNCVYFHTYKILLEMAEALGQPVDLTWVAKADQLQKAINKEFWKPNLGRYITLVDPWGTDERQEALGIAFSILFGVADLEREELMFRNVLTTPAGMPALWPTYPRYGDRGGFGRHSGTVWPHAQAFWAEAAAQRGHRDFFVQELTHLADKAVRDGQFYEIYNPLSGKPDGGLQEGGNGISTWDSAKHQSWSATGYLRLILSDLVGMRFDEKGILFAPLLTGGLRQVDLTGVKYRNAVLNIHIRGTGNTISRMTVNGKKISNCRISNTVCGDQQVVIQLGR